MSEIIESNEPQHAQSVTPLRLIEMAVQSGASIEHLERLMGLQERHEANEARRAYVRALTRFRAVGITVGKDREVNQGAGRPSYKHATLGNAIDTLAPELATNGLCATWNLSQNNALITVTCVLRHEAGHSESVSLNGAPDTGPGRNAIQAVGSAITYLQRYTLMAITGTSTGDIDSDGIATGEAQYITDGEAADIDALIDEVAANRAQFLKWMGVENTADILRTDHRKAVAALEAKRAKA